MIFVTLGSQKFQFNRLLQEVDRLVESGVITEEVYAQTGYSDYRPKNFAFSQFLSRDEFAAHIKASDIVITHGGTGAIIGAVKAGKKVIAFPRLAKYGEHVDDHQLQIIELFKESNLIIGCMECGELEDALKRIDTLTFTPYVSNTDRIIDSIEAFINK
ncbi:MAG: beta(1,3)galactosyltransferase EpsH [Blautia sp.]|nr:beta(1,3)galactosyltransferase EpsH [Blautia sp.]